MKKRIRFSISLLWLIGCFAYACYFVAKYGSCFLDADMSSELVLGKLLSEEGGILSKNWYYSTELRVINNQIVFALLFHLLKSWAAVRTVGSVVLFALLAVSCLFAMRSLDIDWDISFISTGILLLPLSVSYQYAVLNGLFYIPHIVISFVSLGLFLKNCRAQTVVKKRLFLLVSAIVAILGGLGGIRQLFVFYVPLAASALIYAFVDENNDKASEKATCVRCTLVMLIASAVGCLLNKLVLSRIYSFCDYGMDTFGRNVCFTEFSLAGAERFFNMVFGLLGYKPGKLFSGYLVYNCLFALLLLLSILSVSGIIRSKSFSADEKITVGCLCMAVVLTAGIFCFTDMDKIDRYGIPAAVLLVPVIGLYFEKLKSGKPIRLLIAAALVLLASVTGFEAYKTSSRYDANTDIKNVCAYLTENDYSNGYSSFWSGNILTELSDGQIDMTVVGTDYILSRDDLGIVYHWLQPKSHVDTHSNGKVFLVLVEPEIKNCGLEIEPAFKSGKYSVFTFDSFSGFEELYK